jgi:TRAP-type uncharacterized transport system substrate-binding protein
MMTALEHVLEVHRAEVRLRLIATAGLEENYALLEKGDAELAILRADQGLPGDSTVVMILRKSVIVVVAPSSLGLENFSQLKGKRLGLVARSPLDQEGFAKLLTFYGMQKSDIKLTTIKPDQAGPLTDQRQLDAVMVIGPIVDPEVSAVVYAIDRKTKSGPSVLSIDLAALANKNALAASSDTIPQHAFPRRQIPAEEVDTISVPTIIAGNTASGPVREKIRTQAIMQLAQNLIERRMELSRKLGFVVPIEAPENEKGSRMPIHPGTAAYLDSTDIGWYTLFSDQIWTVWLVGGALFSIVAAFFGFLRARKDNPLQEFLRRLNEIAQQAKASLTPDELDVLTENLTDLGVELSALGYERRDDIDSFAPAQLAFENARFAIQTARERKMKQPPFKDDEALQRTAPQRG